MASFKVTALPFPAQDDPARKAITQQEIIDRIHETERVFLA